MQLEIILLWEHDSSFFSMFHGLTNFYFFIFEMDIFVYFCLLKDSWGAGKTLLLWKCESYMLCLHKDLSSSFRTYIKKLNVVCTPVILGFGRNRQTPGDCQPAENIWWAPFPWKKTGGQQSRLTLWAVRAHICLKEKILWYEERYSKYMRWIFEGSALRAPKSSKRRFSIYVNVVSFS